MARRQTPKGPEAASDMDKFILRMPAGLRQQIKDFAAENKRSMNAEILDRLEVASLRNDSFRWLKREVARLGKERDLAERRLRDVTTNESGRTPELLVARLMIVADLPKDDPERVAAEFDAAVYVAGFPLPEVDKIDVTLRTLERFSDHRAEIENKLSKQMAGPLRRVVRFLRRTGWTVDTEGDEGLLELEDVDGRDEG